MDVISHRGASAYRPENTLESYRLAIEMGADGIEADFVPTADGVLVARHENELSATTDVADHPELASRRTMRVVDGRRRYGWFTEDLTLAELTRLRTRERVPRLRPGNVAFDGCATVPTFDEVMELARRESLRRGEVVRVYAELKHPDHFARRGLAPEPLLADALCQYGQDRPDASVTVASFASGSLRRLASMVRTPLVQLVDVTQPYAAMTTAYGLREISTYACGVGLAKGLVRCDDHTGRLAPPTPVVERAHDAGLLAHVWTLRPENAFLPAGLRFGDRHDETGATLAEHVAYMQAGVDGVFSDVPDVAVDARRLLRVRLRAAEAVTARPARPRG